MLVFRVSNCVTGGQTRPCCPNLVTMAIILSDRIAESFIIFGKSGP